MKNKIFRFLSKPYSVIIVFALATLLHLSDRNFGYFFGLGVVIFLVWQNKWDWGIFGFGQKINRKTIVKGLLLTIPIFIGLNIIEPILQQQFGALDLSSVDDVRGDIGNYLFILFIVWTFAAFGEELLFRGYYMQGFAKLFGGSNVSWLMAAFIISAYFGFTHSYQGPAGVIAVFLGGFYFSMVYYFNRNNLVVGALVHGFYDTIALTLIYLNKDGVFSDWILKLFSH